MIVVRYRGGLGNQMFQYAFQTALQKNYPEEIIKADISHYRLLEEHNGFELDKVFGLSMEFASEEEVRSMTNLYVAPEWVLKLPRKLKDRIARKYQYTIVDFYKLLHKEKEKNYYKCKYHNSFEEVVLHLNMEHDWYLDGLWQNLNYFTDCMSEIKNAFSFPNQDLLSAEDKALLGEMNSRKSVSVHIRRGDFINSKFDICKKEYYEKAMIEIEKREEDVNYFFFTDDIDFVKEKFVHVKKKSIINHGIENSIIDMMMMSACNNHIISNSTFSYWGAILDAKEAGNVIAPRYSIVNSIGAYELSAPENWLLIEV